MRGRKGYTLLEVLITTGLMAGLAVLMGQLWRGVARPTLDLVAAGRVSLEANLAVASLRRDLAGAVPGPMGALGGQGLNRLVGRSQPGGAELWLCFDGGAAPNGVADWAAPDSVVIYRVEQGRLVRRDQAAEAAVTIAMHVETLTVQDLGGSVRIVLALSYRGVRRTFTLVGHDP